MPLSGPPPLPGSWLSLLHDQPTSNRLRVELGSEVTRGHALYGRALQVIARCRGCDHVVVRFEDDGSFALVHLTWSGRAELEGLPRAALLPTYVALEAALDAHEH